MIKKIKKIISDYGLPVVLSFLFIGVIQWISYVLFSIKLNCILILLIFISLSIFIFWLLYSGQEIVETIFLYDDYILLQFKYWKPTLNIMFDEIDHIVVYQNSNLTDIFYFINLKNQKRYQIEIEQVKKEILIEYLDRNNVPYIVKQISYEG